MPTLEEFSLKMPRKLRFGLAGAGTHGRTAVIPAFAQATGCELVAVADPHPESLQLLNGSTFRHYPSVETMLKQESLDALYIATLADTHLPLALEAFHAGLHVICEKPMASNLTQARQMVEAAIRAQRQLRVMFENRIHPAYRQIRDWIAAGRIGRVEAIHLQSFGKHPTLQPRRTHLLNAAGCLDCGIHMLDLVRYWTGGGSWKKIHALGTWFDEEVERPPHVGILARLDNGAMVTFEDSFSYGYPLKDLPWDFGRNSLNLVGTGGVIRDAQEQGSKGFELISHAGREWIPMTHPGHAHEIGRVLNLFTDEVLHQRDSILATGEDGCEAQRIVDEINLQACQAAPRFPDRPLPKNE